MGYRNLRQCVEDLQRSGRLIRVEDEIDAHLEAAEIQRRVYLSGGPAVFFANVKQCRFPMVSNLFGTMDRTRFIFRDALGQVRRLVELKIDPNEFFKRPGRYWQAPQTALTMLPRTVRRGPVLANETAIDQLPALTSWPDDGGPFVTLPQVYTEDVESPGLKKSNLGMYRVQLSGGDYRLNEEIGMHYQIHRGIGVHHAAALRQGKPFRVNIFVGGSPAMTLSAVMPLPEGLSELMFAGALARHRIPMIQRKDTGLLPIYAEADFCICGTLDPVRKKLEGPFGDHLGYYSLQHEFPVLNVEKVYHRDGAIWPFTVVGRPPQEDTSFGEIIHEITGPIIPTVIPGVHGVNAVDAAGVHPLMLAVGSERYVPYEQRRVPQELLTQANAILGQGQMSLAKYLLMVAKDDDPSLSVNDIPSFLMHLLERVDWRRDLHFQTRTTIDTLDYSGSGFNEGSKLVLAAVGEPLRNLPGEIPGELTLPDGFRQPRVVLPGVLAVAAPSYERPHEHDQERIDDPPVRESDPQLERFCRHFSSSDPINQFPLIVLVDDSEFTAATLNNFLWVTFTRSNPAADIDGIGARMVQKHWGCTGSLVIDARIKPHHAPPLVEDPGVTKKIDALATRGGPLARYL